MYIDKPPFHFHREVMCFWRVGLSNGKHIAFLEYRSKRYSNYIRHSIESRKPGRLTTYVEDY